MEENYNCLGFVKYPEDYLNDKTPDQPVFGLFLFGLDESISTQNDLNEKYVDVVLPIDSSDTNDFEVTLKFFFLILFIYHEIQPSVLFG